MGRIGSPEYWNSVRYYGKFAIIGSADSEQEKASDKEAGESKYSYIEQ
jgi:hypothetical protein